MSGSANHPTAGPNGLMTTSSSPEASLWTLLKQGPLRVCVLGSGNWGTTIAKIVGNNVRNNYMFQKEVRMYVYEEMVQGRKLTSVINETHENPVYLPGVKLPENVIAVPDVVEAVQGASIIVFVMPHQFVPNAVRALQGKVSSTVKAISLVKGFLEEKDTFELPTDYIKRKLKVETSVLSGANVARDIADEQFAEATVGYTNLESAKLYQQLFDTPYFKVNCVQDVQGVELCGALKNVVALAAGFCDGLKLGTNTKAAVIRLGMAEMRNFAVMFFRGIAEDTFWDSCGMADLITTCFGGRNRKCAEAFVKTRKPWKQIEAELLKGQKLQGVGTAYSVYHFLQRKGAIQQFPLLCTVYRICFEELDPKEVVGVFMSEVPRVIGQSLAIPQPPSSNTTMTVTGTVHAQQPLSNTGPDPSAIRLRSSKL